MSPEEHRSQRAIALFDLDAFFVSVERKINPELKNTPLIVGGKSKRAVVAACSYETRVFGVHSAMPMVSALKLCPKAIVVPPNRSQYVKHSQWITQIIAENFPHFEKASIDEFYVDFTGLGSFMEGYAQATQLRNRIIAETELIISFALSQNKLVSKIAVDTVKPNGQTYILPGTEADFLAPMKVEKIPMIGKETARNLHQIGVFTIAQLARCSKDTLRTFFGKHGETLVYRAKGIDYTPVNEERKHKSISTETTFEEDRTNESFLKKAFVELNHRNHFQLKKSGYFASCVALKIRFNDFETVNRQITIAPTTSEKQLEKQLLYLFKKHYINGDFKGRRVRLIGVRYSGLLTEGFQLDLFDNNPKTATLEKTLQQLKDKFGKNYITRASEL